jgi:hypothetical protein
MSQSEPSWRAAVPTKTLGLLCWVLVVPAPVAYVVWRTLVSPPLGGTVGAAILVWLLGYNIWAGRADFDVRTLAREAADELAAL